MPLTSLAGSRYSRSTSGYENSLLDGLIDGSHMFLELPKVIDVDDREDKSVAVLIMLSCALQLVHYIRKSQCECYCNEAIVGPQRAVITSKMLLTGLQLWGKGCVRDDGAVSKNGNGQVLMPVRHNGRATFRDGGLTLSTK